MRIVDSHVHVGDWPEYGLSFPFAALEQVAVEYDYVGSVVMPALTGNPTYANEQMLDAVKRRKDSMIDLYPFVWVQPQEPLIMNWLRQRRDRYVGLKFHASISQKSLLDNDMQSVLAFADDERLPLIYHCGRTPISWAENVKVMAPVYPHVKFIVAHLGGNAYDQIIRTFKLFDEGRTVPRNVFFDTATARHPELLARLFHGYGHDRIIFGTDLPFTDQRLNFDCLRYAGLDRHVDVMGENLLKLLES